MARKAAKEKEGIGARVEMLRKERGWTQQELADMIFLKREALKNKELGLRPFSLDEVCTLSGLFNVTLDYLVNGTSTENVDFHKKTGLTDKGIEALETYNLLDDGNRMEVISNILAYPEVLDALYEYVSFRPGKKGYFRKTVGDDSGDYVTCMMSPELYEDQLQAVMTRVIRLAKYGIQPSWFYSSLENYFSSEGDEQLKLAETSEFKGVKKNAKKK